MIMIILKMIDHNNSQEDVEEAGELVFRQNKQTNEPITHHTKLDYYDNYDDQLSSEGEPSNLFQKCL